MSEYEGCVVSSDREPETQIVVTLDADGYVCGEVVRANGGGSKDFIAFMRKHPRFPMMEIVWPDGARVDHDGRGYSVPEMIAAWESEQQVDAAQERAA